MCQTRDERGFDSPPESQGTTMDFYFTGTILFVSREIKDFTHPVKSSCFCDVFITLTLIQIWDI